MRNIFLEKLLQNVLEKLFPDSFLKEQNWELILWINSLKFYHFVFIVCQVESYRNILKLSCRLLAFTSFKGPGTSLPASFSILFLKGNTCLVKYSINWPSFIIWLPLLREIMGNMCYCNCLLTRLQRQKFWNCPYLSNQAVFSAWPKSEEKNLNILGTKFL